MALAPPAFAKTAAELWKVSQRTGEAQVIRSGMQPVALITNGSLQPGDLVVTGATGRVVLTRGGDYVVVAPSSRLLLPKAEQPGGFTRLIQQVGTMLYKVKHTGIPHFAVDTPMLAAVVKGTSFTVIVDQDRAAVQVTDGIVEVTAAVGGMQKLVEGGNTVFINRDHPRDLIEATAATIGTPSPDDHDKAFKISASPEESLSTIATLTSGLIRVDPVPASLNGTVTLQTAMLTQAIVPARPATPATSQQQTSAGSPAAATAPVTTAPAAAAPAAAAPSVAAPAVTTPAVTTPAVTTPAVTAPAVTTPAVTTPAVTTPSVTTPAVTTPAVSVPAISVPQVTTPAITTPAVTVPAVTTPVVTTPAITLPAVTVPAVTVPAVTVPAITTPAVTVPAVTVPAVSVPAISVPAITTPAVTVPAVTTPAISVPAISVPAITTPAVTVPAVTVPAVTTPAVTVPAVTVPAVTVPAVTVPAITTPAITTPAVTLPPVSLPSLGGLFGK